MPAIIRLLRWELMFPFVAAVSAAAPTAAPTSAPAVAVSVPDADGIYPDSGFRLPLLRRESLDAEGRSAFDRLAVAMNNAGASGPGVGFKGPSGIALYSPRLAEIGSDLNSYLRFQAGLDGRTREVAILAVARETDSAFEWAAHEPIARREGVEDKVIEVIRHRAGLAGLNEHDRTIIRLAREGITTHRVSRQTFDSALKLFGPKQLTDLTGLMGNYLSNTLTLNVFGMQTPPGQASLPPIRR
jgi:4-carboxymuconolactone decarboxylase